MRFFAKKKFFPVLLARCQAESIASIEISMHCNRIESPFKSAIPLSLPAVCDTFAVGSIKCGNAIKFLLSIN